MPAVVKHPTSKSEKVIQNDGFFPDIPLNTLRDDYGIDDRTEEKELSRIIRSNMIRVNDDLNDWQKCQLDNGYNTLAAVPSKPMGELTIYEISYEEAICYGVKADVIRSKLDFDQTSKGDQEAEEREDKAMHYTAQSTRALRQLLGRGHIRVKRIKTKNNNNSPLDNLLRYGHGDGE